MTEVDLLQVLVLWTFLWAPRMTSRLFLKRSRVYDVAHAVAFVAIVASAALDVRPLTAVWPAFCALGFALHLRSEGARLLSMLGVARAIPFVFSLVSAVWFVAGRNDLRLLGYGRAWSDYAALHGSVLGWLVVGCTAFAATRARGLYLTVCWLSLPLFLFVAFGIDGVPYLKRIGAVGFSLLVPLVLGRYALDVRSRAPTSFRFAVVACFGIVMTMTLALLNELWSAFPRTLQGLPTMVLLHGVVNALVVTPSFFLAIACEPAASVTGGESKVQPGFPKVK